MSGDRILYQIQAEGTYQGREAYAYHILGKRDTFPDTTTLCDIGEHLTTDATFTELTGAESFEMVSSSANDTAAGTGTRQVHVIYADTNGDMQDTIVTMNGVTPVALTGISATFIYGIEAHSGGSSEVSAGNIDLRLAGGGAIRARIVAGGNKSLAARFMVPRGFEGFLVDWDVGAVKQSVDFRLRAQVHSFNGRAYNSRYLFQDTAYLAANTRSANDLPWLRLPALSKIKVSARVDSVTQVRTDADFTVVIIKG
jgi:hypothetical protein